MVGFDALDFEKMKFLDFKVEFSVFINLGKLL